MAYLSSSGMGPNNRGWQPADLQSQLLRERIVMLAAAVDDDVAHAVSAQLLHLAAEDEDSEISLYINSPGGSITAMFAIYDTMQFVPPPVSTYCNGMAASAAAVILAAGAPGRRHALPNARMLLHQPRGGGEGTALDVEIQAREVAFLQKRVEEVLALHTGQPIERIRRDLDRDFVLSAREAVDYGLIDAVVATRKRGTGRREGSMAPPGIVAPAIFVPGTNTEIPPRPPLKF